MMATLIQRYNGKQNISFQERETNWNFTGCQVPHFMIVLIPYINLWNLSLIIKCLVLRNMEPLLLQRNICFEYLLESPLWGNSNKYPKHMFFDQIRTNQDHSYISICLFNILYNSKFILMTTYFGTNAVIKRGFTVSMTLSVMGNKQSAWYRLLPPFLHALTLFSENLIWRQRSIRVWNIIAFQKIWFMSNWALALSLSLSPSLCLSVSVV